MATIEVWSCNIVLVQWHSCMTVTGRGALIRGSPRGLDAHCCLSAVALGKSSPKCEGSLATTGPRGYRYGTQQSSASFFCCLPVTRVHFKIVHRRVLTLHVAHGPRWPQHERVRLMLLRSSFTLFECLAVSGACNHDVKVAVAVVVAKIVLQALQILLDLPLTVPRLRFRVRPGSNASNCRQADARTPHIQHRRAPQELVAAA